MPRRTVRETAEFRRIDALPRRVINARDAEAWGRFYTREFALDPNVSLTPWQGLAFYEMSEYGGAMLVYPVGTGKTYIMCMGPLALELDGEPTLMLVPANMRDKTYSDMSAMFGKWRLPNPAPHVWSFHELIPPDGDDKLKRLAPRAVFIDECDELANPRHGAFRKLERFKRANPHVPFVLATGTLLRKSLKDVGHLLWLVFGDRGMPLPRIKGELSLWSSATDDYGGKAVQRADPGPLGTGVSAARTWVRERLAQTPGLVVLDVDSAGDVPLEIVIRPAREDGVIDRHYRRFLEKLESPRGVSVVEPLQRWMADAYLGTGLTSYYNPEPPQEWRDARRSFCRFAREVIDDSQRTAHPIDTEGVVIRRFPEHPAVVDWLAVKELFDAENSTYFEWLSDSGLLTAEAWLRELTAPGVFWCGPEFGIELARRTGLPFYGRGGVGTDGTRLHAADSSRSLIASWFANKKGFNLQAWEEHAVIQPPQSAKWLEQLIGRAHRMNRVKPVRFTLFATSGGTYDAFTTALSEAGYGQEILGPSQKILRADVKRVRPPRTRTNEWRWANKDKRDEITKGRVVKRPYFEK